MTTASRSSSVVGAAGVMVTVGAVGGASTVTRTEAVDAAEVGALAVAVRVWTPAGRVTDAVARPAVVGVTRASGEVERSDVQVTVTVVRSVDGSATVATRSMDVPAATTVLVDGAMMVSVGVTLLESEVSASDEVSPTEVASSPPHAARASASASAAGRRRREVVAMTGDGKLMADAPKCVGASGRDGPARRTNG